MVIARAGRAGSLELQPGDFLLVIVTVVLLTMQIVRRNYRGARAPGAGLGLRIPIQTPRMQDTGEGLGSRSARYFGFFRIESVLPSPIDLKPQYQGIDRRSFLAMAVPADRTCDRARGARRRPGSSAAGFRSI